jgi:hypothetical protein
MSHSRQPSGLISSARMMRAKSPSHTRPNSSLKSTRRMPIAGEHAAQEVVDADRHVGDVVHLLVAGPAEAGDVLVGDQRVAERVVLVIVFDDRARQLLPSSIPRRLDSEPAATLRTTTSSGMISTWRINCSRMLRRRMKWVGMPIAPAR